MKLRWPRAATAALVSFIVILHAIGLARADGCRTQPGPTGIPGVVNVAVRESTTDKPVAAALVNWSFTGHEMTGSTDNQGNFAFRLPIADRARGEAVKATIERNGFMPLARSVRACPGQNPALAVVLSPSQRFGTVKGRVTDSATGQGIGDVRVTIRIGRFPQPGLEAITDSNGSYAIAHVGFSQALTLDAMIPDGICMLSASRNLNVDRGIIIKNISFRIPVRVQLGCPPLDTDEAGGVADRVATRVIDLNGTSSPKPFPADNPAFADDTSIQWMLATAEAIQDSSGQNMWNSGHINDILKIGPTQTLIASDTGGVWSMAFSSSTAAAIPLSTAWRSVAISSLAQGPDGESHVYAGTYSNPSLAPGGPGERCGRLTPQPQHRY